MDDYNLHQLNHIDPSEQQKSQNDIENTSTETLKNLFLFINDHFKISSEINDSNPKNSDQIANNVESNDTSVPLNPRNGVQEVAEGNYLASKNFY